MDTKKIFFLPGQRREWRKQIIKWSTRAFILALFIGSTGMWLLKEHQLPNIFKDKDEKILAQEKKIFELREELGILNGVVFATFGKNTPIIIEQFRLKQKGGKP